MSKRIYLVKDSETGGEALIRAGMPAGARNIYCGIILGNRVTVEVAKQDDLVRLLDSGSKVIDPSAEPPAQQQLGAGQQAD